MSETKEFKTARSAEKIVQMLMSAVVKAKGTDADSKNLRLAFVSAAAWLEECEAQSTAADRAFMVAFTAKVAKVAP